MPIIIKEEDNTAAGISEYSNFTVVVPGFINAANKAKWKKSPFDENNIYECNSQYDFDIYIGKVDGRVAAGQRKSDIIHYGNQIAYELLGLGYKVLYYNLGDKVSVENLEVLDTIDWCLPLADKSIYDFRYIINGLLTANTKANNVISTLASFKCGADKNPVLLGSADSYLPGRGDCTALIDIDESKYNSSKSMSEALTAIKAEVGLYNEADKYTAIFVPSVYYKYQDDEYMNNKFPASFHYLACAAASANKNFAEWYAVSGYTRGVTPKYAIDGTTLKLGEAAVNALQPRHAIGEFNKSVNIVAKMKKKYYLWGNRTAQELGAKDSSEGDLIASHFLNIRQLCTTIKKQAYTACNRFKFDPNSDVLWINLTSTIIPMLERMKADQGINDYRIIKVKSNKKATLTAIIRIIPIEAVEDFDITLSLEDSFGEAVASINE